MYSEEKDIVITTTDATFVEGSYFERMFNCSLTCSEDTSEEPHRETASNLVEEVTGLEVEIRRASSESRHFLPPEREAQLSHVSGLSEGSDVTQTPSILWSIKGQPAEMDCSHTKGALYYQMYWYRQLPGQGMKQVVYSVPSSKPDFGEFGEVKFSANKTVAERGSFTVKNSSPEDNGMYFCAVYEHSDTDIMCSCTETPNFS
ncbi:uncharacterized protein LOC134026624 [Osmerus eperlanus]|uniref:uncharacterized protein LOC134026624 n=1 Tax=Osmerus eperlanus TaxID=29151 RepID=UPI002E1358A1